MPVHRYKRKGDTSTNLQFMIDGCERIWAAMEPTIRKQVEEEYADQWENSGLIRRWFLRRKVKSEIVKRMSKIAPPNALY